MIQYLKYPICVYVIFYLSVNFFLRGRVYIGFISWLHLLYINITLGTLNIRIGSVSVSVRPLYFLHRKKLKAKNHDGLIIIDVHRVEINLTKVHNKSKLSSRANSPPKMKKELDPDSMETIVIKLLNIMKRVRVFLPLTIVIHDISIINHDQFINIGVFSSSINCILHTNKFTNERCMKNALHFSLANVVDKNRKIIKDVKWSVSASSSIEKPFTSQFASLSSVLSSHAADIHVEELLELISKLFPMVKKPTNSDTQKDLAAELDKQKHTDITVLKILNKFKHVSLYLSLNDNSFSLNELSLNIKTLVFSLNTDNKQKKNKSCTKHDNPYLYKAIISLAGVKILYDLIPDSRFVLEFLNYYSIIDATTLLYCLKNLKNVDSIKEVASNEGFILRTFLTAPNLTLITSLQDILTMKEHFKRMKYEKAISKTDNQVEIKEPTCKVVTIIENLLRLSHRFRTKFQFLTTTVQVALSDDMSALFTIDDLLVDSSLSDSMVTLFDINPDYVSTKSIYSSLKNIQFIIVNCHLPSKVFVLDSLDASIYISVFDEYAAITSIKTSINHIEVLTESINNCKKLSKIATSWRNREPSKEINELIDAYKQKVYNLQKNEKDGLSEEDSPPYFIPKLIEVFDLSIKKITLVSCFNNPVKYWDGEDQSELNKFKRGFSVVFEKLSFISDNTLEVPDANFRMKDFSIFLIRDFDNEKLKKKYKRIFLLENMHIKYTHIYRKVLISLPLTDGCISVEVLWTFFYIITILKSIKGVKLRNDEKGITTKPLKKISKRHLQIHFSAPLIMLKVQFPSDVSIVIEIDSLKFVKASANNDKNVLFKVCRIYCENPHAVNFWTLLMIVSDARITLKPKDEVPDDGFPILIESSDIRIEIPYQYIFYRAFDNFKAFLKSSKKLKKNFKDLMYVDEDCKSFKVDVIGPSLAEHPFRMPKIRIKSKRILYCSHDDPFEEELTNVYMIGSVVYPASAAKLKAFSKYETKIKKKLRTKYEKVLEFDDDDEAIIPSALKHTTSSTYMRKSVSTGTLRATDNNEASKRRINSSGSFNSKLRNQVMPDDAQAWHDYRREYHTAVELPRHRMYRNLSKTWVSAVKNFRDTKKSGRNASSTTGEDPYVRKEFLRKYPVITEGSFQPLFSLTVTNPTLDLDVPEFGLDNYAEFMYRVAGGMPKDMKYGIFVPMNLKLSCKEFVVQIKDYPLPLVGLGGAQYDMNDAIIFKGDLVICEQAYTEQEIRYNFVPCVPQYNDIQMRDNLYAFHISRTMTNIKFVTDMNIHVNSLRSAAVSWAPSLQPGMSYAFDSFDLLSKPPLDISPKIGFWDKMPLLVPSKFTFHFKNGITLFIKSSQSPYDLLGKSAGFAFKWNDDAKLLINSTGKSEDFLIVQSNKFEIGVPVFDSNYIGNCVGAGNAAIDYKFAKIVLKLTSKPIIWKLGFIFERNKHGEMNATPGSVERTKRFIPHYKVTLRNPDTFSSNEDKEKWDSYHGWRSQYIYLSLSAYSRDDNKCKEIPFAPLGTTYNSLYLSYLTFYYFYFWWDSFKSSLGLPIKAGAMFKNDFLSDKKSPKFGSTVHGISYVIDLSPLYLTHVYQHSSTNNNSGKLAFTGLKGFVESFTMDLHQSRQEVIVENRENHSVTKEYKLRMKSGIVDLINADIRIITAVFNQVSASGILAKKMGIDSVMSDTDTSSTNSDNTDRAWYDHDDFVELEGQQIPNEEPKWKVYQFVSTPRFYYVRDLPSLEVDFPFDVVESETHNCQIEERDLIHAAPALVDTRIREVEDLINFNNYEISDLEGKNANKYVQKTLANAKRDQQELHHRLHILRCLRDSFSEGIFPQYDEFVNDQEESDDEIRYELLKAVSRVSSHVSTIKSKIPSTDARTSDYINRFSIYTPSIRWTRSVKSGFFRYLEMAKNGRMIAFSLSHDAVRLAEELRKAIRREVGDDPDFSFTQCHPEVELERSDILLDDFDKVLHDTSGLAEAEIEDSFLVKLILPQVAITSDGNKCLLITNNKVVLNSITVKGYQFNELSSELTLPLETRHGLLVTDLFAYVLERETALTNKYRLFTPKAVSWPPKLPIEMYYTPVSLDESVVVQNMSFALIYVKPNELHLSKDGKSNNAGCKELLRVATPSVDVVVNSEQLNFIRIVATNMFANDKTEIQKTKDAVKKFVRYSDFSNYDQLCTTLRELQLELHELFQCRLLLVEANRGTSEHKDTIMDIHVEIERNIINLNAIVDILQTTKTQKYNELHKYLQFSICAPIVKVLLMTDTQEPFIELNASDTCYMFTQSPTGESVNTFYINEFTLSNRHKEATFDTITRRLKNSDVPMFRLDWTLLPPVGGIAMVYEKIFSFGPLKIQFNMKFAGLLQEFFFPNSEILKNDYDIDNDYDEFLNDVESISSDSSAAASTASSNTKLNKEGKISRVLHKIWHKSSVKESSAQLSRTSSLGSTNSYSTSIARSSSVAENVSIMDERASKYSMVRNITINPIEMEVTFHGKGVMKLIKLTDFPVKMPTQEINNRIISNEEFFALVKHSMISYVLKNTHNLIKSSIKKSTHTSGNPRSPSSTLRRSEEKKRNGSKSVHNTSHLHKVDGNKHMFKDADLLGPTVNSGSFYVKNPSPFSEIMNSKQEFPKSGDAIDEAKVFRQLEDVTEEDEGTV